MDLHPVVQNLYPCSSEKGAVRKGIALRSLDQAARLPSAKETGGGARLGRRSPFDPVRRRVERPIATPNPSNPEAFPDARFETRPPPSQRIGAR